MKNLLKTLTVTALLLFIVTSCNKDVDVTGVTLNQENLTLAVGETATLIATVLPDDATDKTVNWTSSNPAIATVTDGVVTAIEVGDATITVTTMDGNFTKTCSVEVTPVIPEWIEIDGVKWATRNIDAPGTFAANPEDAGMFYQWNRKTGWSSSDPMTGNDGETIWDETFPTGDSWEKTNDPSPAGWRLPTNDELRSLMSSGRELGELNGVPGCYFGTGDDKVFFPAAGFREYSDGMLEEVDIRGCYWSATPNLNKPEFANFMDSFDNLIGLVYCTNGLSVRCVLE